MTAPYDGFITINRYDLEGAGTAGLKVYVNGHQIINNTVQIGNGEFYGVMTVTFPVNKGDVFYYDTLNNTAFSSDTKYQSSWIARWYKL